MTKGIIGITGAASGIGAATARLLAQEGYETILFDRDAEGLFALGKELGHYGADCQGYGCDVTNTEEVETLLNYHEFDGMVLAAGICLEPYVSIQDISLDAVQEVIEVNVFGVLNFLRYAKINEGGVVVIVGSIAGVTSPSCSVGYGASKAAVNSVYMTAKEDFQSRGVRLSIVYPGNIDTPLKREIIYAEAAKLHENGSNSYMAHIADKDSELSPPGQVAEVIRFLLSPAAGGVKGGIFVG